MYFIAILIMLVVTQFWSSWQILQKDSLYYRWQSIAVSLTENPLFAYIASVLVPCIALIILHAVLKESGNWALWLVDFFITVLVLIYSLGRGAYNINEKSYCNAWQTGDFETARKIVQLVDEDYQPEVNETIQRTHVAARESFIYSGFTRFFVVLFWFTLLGPVAALCYRLTVLFNATQNVEVAKNVRVILEWPAGRLLSIAFALMGDFASGITSLLTTLFNIGMTTKQVIHANALAALNFDMSWLDGKFPEMYNMPEQTEKAQKEIAALKELLKRCLVFAVIVIAIFQIFR